MQAVDNDSYSDGVEEQARSDAYLDGLNAPQREAVETLDGPLLVLAGAGTGKTRVLTSRIAHIIQTGHAWPSQILAVTFTNKAAQEMRERVSAALGGHSVDGLWLGTFHALAVRILRRHADILGFDTNFTILDTDDQVRLIKQIMENTGADVKKNPPKQVAARIGGWKDKALLPDDVAASAKDADGQIISLYRLYQSRLKELSACDFGDLILHVITLFKNPDHADILAQYHRMFKYILVDEYQDTNVAQYQWLRLLVQGAQNVCCVGDDDQSIYGWRGAEVGNILRFEHDFPGAKIIRLEQNYRSTGHILAAASGVIAKNESRLGKTLHTDSGDGDKVSVRGLWDGQAEARWVGEEIEKLCREGWTLGQMAVLVRAGFQTREFEERFIKLGIPYQVLGGLRFYERQEIRDALAYLRVIVQPADDLALERIINVPKRAIGDSTVKALYDYARMSGISLYESMKAISETDELRPQARKSLAALVAHFENWREMLENSSHAEIVSQVLEDSGYTEMWQKDKSPDAPGRLENLKELVSVLTEFESLQEFLEHVALVLENTDQKGMESVTLMTLHAAKGLEFDAVFLPGWEEGLFPSQRTMDEQGVVGLEEERRLAYVGITRARKRAHISFAANRRMYGNWISAIPSRFIDELPSENVETLADPGLSGSGRSSHWDSSGFKPTGLTKDVRRGNTGSYRSAQSVQRTKKSDFCAGQSVFHDKFGIGTIIHVDGQKLDIEFEKGGHKRVLDSFVEPHQ